jgi:hypothetical protein
MFRTRRRAQRSSATATATAGAPTRAPDRRPPPGRRTGDLDMEVDSRAAIGMNPTTTDTANATRNER